MHISASKIKVMSAIVPSEQHHAALLVGWTVDDVNKFKHISSVFIIEKPHKWTEELRIGQMKKLLHEHCGSRTPQPANEFKMANRRMKLPLNEAQYCSLFGFFVTFLLRNKALVYLLNKVLRRVCILLIFHSI